MKLVLFSTDNSSVSLLLLILYKQSEQEIILQKLSNQHIRVAVVGNVDSGKSTLIGSLVSSSLDDGRGMARSTIMKHKHELTSGRTSTIGVHVLGLDDNYQTVSGSDYKDVVLKSNRLVSLMDLAGVSSKFERLDSKTAQSLVLLGCA
jgi:GTPase